LARLEIRARLDQPILQPLRGHNFRLFWIGQSISLLGDQFHFVALPWLTLQLTDSGLALGTVLTAAAIPRAIFMLVGGVLSDRFPPHVIMLYSNAWRALLVGLLSALAFADVIQLWHLYLLALAFGLIDALFYPASMAIIPSLVEDEHLEAGNSLTRGSQMLSVLIGPAPAGLLVSTVGIPAAFAVDAGTFLVATITLWMMRPHQLAAPVEPQALQLQASESSIIKDLVAGIRYAWKDPILRALLLIIAGVDFAFMGPINVGLATMAERRFLGEATAFGVMLSGFGGGALIGTIIAGSLGQLRRRGRLMIWTGAVMGLGLAAIGRAPNLILVTGIIGIIGMGSGFINIALSAWLQRRSEAEMLGRVMSLVVFASVGLSPISYTLAGALADWDLTWTFFAAGALVLLTILYAASNRDVREID
jgi:MFS family permease